MQWRSQLDLVAAIAMIVAAAAMLSSAYCTSTPDPIGHMPPQLTDFDPARTLGASSAPVGMVVFTDFRCRFCEQFATQVLPRLKSAYVDTGLLELDVRHLPLNRSRPQALLAARAAECGRAQGRFWDVHDALFAGLPGVTAPAPPDGPVTYSAAESGVEPEAFASCMALQTPDELIHAHVAEAEAWRVTATPTILLGRRTTGRDIVLTRKGEGARSFDTYARVIDAWLAER